jgi:hypothetical protein
VDLAAIGLVAGSGWASGVNLYAATALLGIFGRLGYGDVPDVLMRTDTIVVAAVLFALEFVADKIPYVDSLWDVAHTVIRPLGALVLGLLLTGEAETWQQALSGIGAGGLATASHVAKATTRAAINTSPEPASNVLASLAEDGLVAAVIWFAVTNPWLALTLVVVLLVAGTVLTVTLFAAARRAIRTRRERRAARRRAAGGTGRPRA